MLQTFRERLQGWIVWFIISLLVLGLAFFGVENYWLGTDRSHVVAKIGAYKITDRLLNQVYNRVRQQMSASGRNISLTDAMQEKLRLEILNNLIKNKVELKTVWDQGFRITPRQVEANILSMPIFYENNQFSSQKFHSFLTNLGYTPSQFFSAVEESLLIDQMREGIFDSAFFSGNEANRALAFSYQKRTFRYLELSANHFHQLKVPTESEIQSYYEKNKTDFRSPERVKLAFIKLSIDEIRKKLTVSVQEAESYYQENRSLYPHKTFKEVKAEIKKILLSEKAQEAFASAVDQLTELSYTHPDELKTTAASMRLPLQFTEFLTRESKTGLMSNPAFAKAAFSELVLQGQNSDPVRIKEGEVVVLRLQTHEPSRIKPLSQVKPLVVERLKKVQQERRVKETGEKLLNQLQKGENIEGFLSRHHLSWKIKNDIRSNNKDINPLILKAAFDTRTYAGVELPNGHYALVQVKAVQPASPETITKEEYASFKKVLEKQQGTIDYSFYIKSILEKTKVKTYK